MSRSVPAVLTIAGSDSGGGAGIQADLRTFAALGVHGTTAVTCLTAQNPHRITAIEPCSPATLQRQLEAIWTSFHPSAAKTGMLFSAGLIRVVARFLRAHPNLSVVVDPVMISTSGTLLLRQDAIQVLRRELLPLATLLTPNVPEAEFLLAKRISTPEDLRQAARALHKEFGCAALVKGGHLRGLREAVDIFYDRKNELLLSAAFIRRHRTHGTGCTCSAAIAAHLALGYPLMKAVELAKTFVTQAIVSSHRVARQSVLGP